ncbi:tRNA 2-selenouridine(34) synthase MnmH [Paenibacillus xerothermodurans]|uniref:tRNA 2-selenouridine(34) synthase MnmH n=1 Tax=Paenibacillus xerothermodurans TaxID=1977292 RepID=A0A2W1ND48_PAEXE|nr:tRNA 2-selenouridine(34) synthase MnmH [Paenibacillus xerothermodurans]PZE21011.1 tRNA 2-selenouridine(34) synthase MnmH [Paenibacillus xerothermodurans]
MFQDITVEELLEQQRKRELVLIDVRSSSEYNDFTIPGSVNIPLFNDAERAEIGTIYKQESVEAAKQRGLEIVSAKLPAFIKRFQEIDQRKAVFCWRGGMRSRTAATLLSLMGIRVYRITGGIRQYRSWVVETLRNFELKSQMVVIHGLTGAGKTAVLHKLAQKGFPVLDIEQLAGHRGSIFGHIGVKPNNQKTFEALLLQELLRFREAPFLVMEAESKRIGKVVMPEFLVEAKERGIQLFLDIPLEQRVRHIIEDYDPMSHKEECIEAFQRLRRRLHTPVAAQIGQHFLKDDFAEGVALLLEHYYDPRYEHAGEQYEAVPERISASDPDEAAEKIAGRLTALMSQRQANQA